RATATALWTGPSCWSRCGRRGNGERGRVSAPWLCPESKHTCGASPRGAHATPLAGKTEMAKDLPPPRARLPVKLHRRVALVLTEDAVLAEELLARRKLAQDVAGRLSDRVLLLRPGRVEAVVEELQRMGQTPRVIGR